MNAFKSFGQKYFESDYFLVYFRTQEPIGFCAYSRPTKRALGRNFVLSKMCVFYSDQRAYTQLGSSRIWHYTNKLLSFTLNSLKIAILQFKVSYIQNLM